jgi:hypothetical protein
MRRYGVVGLVCLVVGCTPSEEPVEAVDAAEDSMAIDSTAGDSAMNDSAAPDTLAEDTAADTTPVDSAIAETTADTTTADVADSAVADSVVIDSTADTTEAAVDSTASDTAMDTATDTATDTAMDTIDAPATTACGAPPYASLDPLSAFLVSTSMSPITISANICPATKIVVNPDEKKFMDVTKGVPFFLTGTQTGSLPGFTPEYNLPVALTTKLPAGVVIFDTSLPPSLANPAWDATTMAFLHMGKPAVKSGATAPCDTVDGITYAVTGHPEAVFKYTGDGTTTNNKGTAYATIVTTGTAASPEYVTITASKPSCAMGPSTTAAILLTGRIPVAKGHSNVNAEFMVANP